MVRAALALFAVLILANWLTTGMNPIESLSSIINEIDDKATRGQLLTHQTTPASELRAGPSLLQQDPAALCEEAAQHLAERSGTYVPVSLRAYTMARVIRSERTFGGPTAEAIAIAWVLLNVANKSYDGDVFRAACNGNTYYGPQGIHGSRFATTVDPYEVDYSIALSILIGETPDPTRGACNFVHPRGFKTTERYEEVKADWMAKGLKPIAIDGAPMIEVFA